MIERIEELPQGVDGLRLSGRITADDYRRVVAPLLEQARRDQRRVRLLIHTGEDFAGYTLGGALEDLRIALRSFEQIERLALATDHRWVRRLMCGTRMLVPYAVAVYREPSIAEAIAWLSGARDEDVVAHHVECSDVLVVEPEQPLRRQDIGEMEAAVDDMIEGDGLTGIVVHTRALPGWDSLGSLWRHVRFAREHAEDVRRVAIVADGQLANLAPRLAGLLGVDDVEVVHFGYNELDEAVSWAHDSERERN